MGSTIKKINNTFSKMVLIAGVFVLSFFITNAALAGTAEMRVKNNSQGSYFNQTWVTSGDTFSLRIFYLGDAPASSIVVTLPADLQFAGGVATQSGNTATAETNGQTITFNFASASAEVIIFNATVAGGSSLSTNHSFSVGFTTNGTPASSTSNATVYTGPILKTINGATSASGGDATATNLTLKGHGFTQVSDITSITLSNGTNIVQSLGVSGPDSEGLYTITGTRIDAGTAVGAHYIILTATVSGTALSTEANTSETVIFTVSDGTEPVMSSAVSFVHSTGVLTLTFNETIDVSETDLSKITLFDAAAAGNSLVLTGATKSTTDSTTVTFTLSQSQKNIISGWGQTVTNLYTQITSSGIFDLTGNALAAQGSRTSFTTWTKDTTQPTASLTYTQNGVNTDYLQAGDVTITATFSEPLSGTPQIAIDQPGPTDIGATNMTGSGVTWSYTYTINAASDGAAAVTISNASDYANNASAAASNATFTIDRLAPAPAITTAQSSASGQTSVNLSWTPTYIETDFSTYKIYYSTSSSVSSSNGTEISKNSSGYSSLGTSSTGSITVSGLTAGTTYYFAIYICDTTSNCSAISNIASVQTQPNAIVPPSGGGGGGTTFIPPSTTSSAGTITATGGSVTATLATGSAASVLVPANTFTTSSTITVAEATNLEKANAQIPSSQGVIVPNTVFNIQSSAAFTNPLTLEFAYESAALGALDPNSLRIAYYDTAAGKWITLDSAVNPTARKIQAQTTHFTLFAVISVTTPEPLPTTPTTPAPDSDNGQILGSSVGVYPNGTLLKSPDYPAVWYIENDQRHIIRSRAIFDTRFNMADVVRLPSSRQLDLYGQGTDVSFAINTLVKEQGKSDVYRISATSGRQPILSAAVFLARNYRWSDIIEVEPGFLADYPIEAYVSDPDSFYTGDLVKVAGKNINYLVSGPALRRIPSSDIFASHGFKANRVRPITTAQFNKFALEDDLAYPDGTLLRGSGATIYIVSDGKKRGFHSGLDLDALLYNRQRIRRVADSLLAKIENASPVRLVQKDIHTASN